MVYYISLELLNTWVSNWVLCNFVLEGHFHAGTQYKDISNHPHKKCNTILKFTVHRKTTLQYVANGFQGIMERKGYYAWASMDFLEIYFVIYVSVPGTCSKTFFHCFRQKVVKWSYVKTAWTAAITAPRHRRTEETPQINMSPSLWNQVRIYIPGLVRD